MSEEKTVTYKGVKPTHFTPEPPTAPTPSAPFTPIGFSEPGDPVVAWDLPLAIQFHKAVALGGRQFGSIDLKQDKNVRVKLDYAHGLVFVRFDSGTSIAVAACPMDNVHCMSWGMNQKHAGGPPVSQNPDVVSAALTHDPGKSAPARA